MDGEEEGVKRKMPKVAKVRTWGDKRYRYVYFEEA